MWSDFGHMLSVGAIHFEDRFCTGRKGMTGEGVWVHRSGWQCMAAVVAACTKALVNAGWAICLPSCTNGHRKCSFHLARTPFLAFQAAFSLEERSLLGGPWLLNAHYWVGVSKVMNPQRVSIKLWLKFPVLAPSRSEIRTKEGVHTLIKTSSK